MRQAIDRRFICDGIVVKTFEPIICRDLPGMKKSDVESGYSVTKYRAFLNMERNDVLCVDNVFKPIILSSTNQTSRSMHSSNRL